jgi:hypothetical protein
VSGPRCSLDLMAAELVQNEDPNDPEVILRDLSERERLLHAWRLAVIATSRAGYYDEIDAVRDGTAQTVPAEDVIPDWQERLAAARAHTQ